MVGDYYCFYGVGMVWYVVGDDYYFCGCVVVCGGCVGVVGLDYVDVGVDVDGYVDFGGDWGFGGGVCG